MSQPGTVADEVARRREAALAGHRGDAATARRYLGDDSGRVRATALGALARADALTADEVVVALADAEPVVRRRAAELAESFTNVDLTPILTDADPSVVEAACWAMGERGANAGGEVISALSEIVRAHSDPLCREAAVAALGAIGDNRGLPAILGATQDKPAVRRRAVLALAPFEGPAVDEALQRALKDRDWQVRQAAEDLTAEE
jgi:HEAT repeat protein